MKDSHKRSKYLILPLSYCIWQRIGAGEVSSTPNLFFPAPHPCLISFLLCLWWRYLVPIWVLDVGLSNHHRLIPNIVSFIDWKKEIIRNSKDLSIALSNIKGRCQIKLNTKQGGAKKRSTPSLDYCFIPVSFYPYSSFKPKCDCSGVMSFCFDAYSPRKICAAASVAAADCRHEEMPGSCSQRLARSVAWS